MPTFSLRRFPCFLLVFGLLGGVSPGQPLQWSGDLPNGTVIAPGSLIILSGNTRVPPGATVTLGAGTVVKASGSLGLTVEGVLIANGTASAPVVFTDYRDDSAGGDSNNNGPSTGYPGGWGRVWFAPGSGPSRLEFVEVRFGGAGAKAQAIAEGAVVRFTHCTFRHGREDGLRVQNCDPVVEDLRCHGNWGSAVSMDLRSNPRITGAWMATNGINGLSLDGGSLEVDGFWDDPDVVYHLRATVSVPAGRRLAVAAGQVIKSLGPSLVVDGSLHGIGTSAQPIVWTSLRDDSAGGDTNNDRDTAGYNGEWGRVEFSPSSADNVLAFVEFRYGAMGSAAQVLVDRAFVGFSDCTFRHSRADGLRIQGSQAVVQRCQFQNNWGSAVSQDLAAQPVVGTPEVTANGINGLSIDGGTLPADAAWDDPDIVYHLRDTVTVPPGRKLTIAPGQVIKSAGRSLMVEGSLRALATATRPIVFTSLRDDSASGDTGGDGPSNGYNGEWGRLEFLPTSVGNELAYVEFRFGAAGVAAAVIIDQAPARLTSCTFRASRADGLRLLGCPAVVGQGRFLNNWGSALSQDLAASPQVTEPECAGNGINGLSLEGGFLPADATWDDPDVVYHLRDSVTVPAGRRLTIKPGQIIKSLGRNLLVSGTLKALGIPEAPIVLTSLRDDSAGGDTDQSGVTKGYNGEWGRVELTPSSSGNELTAVEFRFGAAGSVAQLVIDNAPARIDRCTFRHSRTDGVRILGSGPLLTRGFFHDNWGSALSQDLAASPVVTLPEMRANQINGLSLEGGTLPADAGWDDPDVVYHLRGTVTVPVGRRLTIAPGQIIKSANQGILVEGSLTAVGTPARPICFTSLRDDTVGGDTQLDGATVGYNGEWQRLEFASTSTANQLAHLECRFGGGNSVATVVFSGSEAQLHAVLVRHSSKHAVLAAVGARLTVTSSVLCQNWGSGIRAESGASVQVVNNTLDGNDRGVWADSAPVTLLNNQVTGNRTAGVSRVGTESFLLRYNNVHNPIAGPRNYDGLPVMTGQQGNLDAPPQYAQPAQFDYQLTAGAPGVDAGFGEGTPPLDFLDLGRVDDPAHPNTGAGIPAYVDLGALELNRWLSRIQTPVRPGQIVVGDTLRFASTGKALDGVTRYSWNLGPGLSSSLEDPGLVTFQSPGAHTITFAAISADGTPDPNPASLQLEVVSAPGPLPDLEIISIDAPANLVVGQPFDLSYSVRNSGKAALSAASWVDAVYLSSDPYLDDDDTRLDAQTSTRSLAVDAAYTGTLRVSLNSLPAGADALYLIVSVDDTWTLLETRQLNNERALPVDLAIPELRAGVPRVARFARGGAGYYFRLQVQPGDNLLVRLDDANEQGVNEIYLRRGALPTREEFDLRSSYLAAADQDLLAAAPTPGVWYLLAVGASVPDLGDFTLSLEASPLAVASCFPARAGQLNGSHFQVRGAGFVPGLTAELVGADGERYPAAALQAESFTQLALSFDLAAVPAGVYALVLHHADLQRKLDGALTVTSGGQPRLETKLVVPAVVGYHQLATLYVEYRNTGTAAMPSPLLSVSASQNGQNKALLTLDSTRAAQGLWVSGLPEGFSHTVHFLAHGEIPGWLHPNEAGRIPVYYAGWLRPWDLSYPPVEFNLLATTSESTVPIDWPAFKSALKPGVIRADAWEQVAANLQRQMGSTWGNMMAALAQDATYLGQLGQRVSDAGTLYNFELARADGRLPFSRVEREIDAFAPMAGIPLVFERTFPALISARYELGPLGRGWTHGWEGGLKVENEGAVTIRTRGAGVHFFQPDLRGGYVAETGDFARLVKMADGRFVLQETDGLTIRYRTDGRMESIQDPNGHTLLLEYTGTLLSRLRHSSSGEFSFTYSAAGRLVRITDERGQTIDFAYDPAQEHLLEVRYPSGHAVQYTYGTTIPALHALVERRAAGGELRRYTYDDFGRLASLAFGASNAVLSLQYPAPGEVTLSTPGYTASFCFDADGRVARSRDAAGLVYETAYEVHGRIAQLTDPYGRMTSARYDARGNLLGVSDFLGRSSAFTYDAAGRLSAVTDPGGHTVDYEHDARGNLIQVTHPNATAERYTYDDAGLLVRWTRPSGTKVEFAYDSGHRVSRVQTDDGTLYTYTYDELGRLTRTTDAAGVTIYRYNAANQLARVELPGGRFLDFTYDTLGRRIGVADQTGFRVNYSYGVLGQLHRLTDAANAPLAEYTYDELGRVARLDKGNGSFTTYSYTAAGRLGALTNFSSSGAVLSRFRYTHDAAAQVTGVETAEGDWAYEYDALGQLTRARFVSRVPAIADQDLAYEYDAAGNRIRSSRQGVTVAYRPNVVNEYSEVGSAALSYDPQGNLVVRPQGPEVWRYFFNAIGHLTRVEGPEGVCTYAYDALGNRVASTLDDQRTELVYDPLARGRLLAEYRGDGNLTAHYAHGLGLVGAIDAQGTHSFYDFDPIGSTVGITDTQGAYRNRYAYLPHGEVLLAQEAIPNPFRFVGKMGVTTRGDGLYHMQARDYCPELGRFISRDPLGQKAGFNLYTYAANNPISQTDPWGEEEGFPGFEVFLDGSGLSQVRYMFDGLRERGWNRYFQAMRELNLVSEEDQAMLDRSRLTEDALSALQNVWGWVTDTGGSALNAARDFLAERGSELASGTESFGTWLRQSLTGIQRDVTNWYNQELPKNLRLISDWLSAMLPQVRSRVDQAVQWVGNQWQSLMVGAIDPNEKTAPAGGGTNRFVMADARLTYRIDFENDDQATAPAQFVSIIDDLHPALDWSTLELGEVAFGDHLVPALPGSRDLVVVREITYLNSPLRVEIRVTLDLETGRLQAVFSTLDPATGLPPPVWLGFLPPEDGTGRGQGHLTYSLLPRAGLPSGTEIFNIAQITFDFAETIFTDQVDPHDPSKGVDPAKQARNLLDASPPTSQVRPLPETSTDPEFTLRWDAADDASGSGLAGVDIFYAVDDGPWQLWREKLPGREALFAGDPGRRYSFYSVAVDLAGYIESSPSLADATTLVQPAESLRLLIRWVSPAATLELAWPTSPERQYTLLQAELLSGPWIPVSGFTDLPGTGSTMVCPVAISGPGRLYRLSASPP